MSDCKIYPADTVDVAGNVWPTVGENIRNGGFPKEIKSIDIVIENGVVVNAPSFVMDSIKDNYVALLNRTVIFGSCLEVTKEQIHINGTACYYKNGSVLIEAKNSSGIIRIFYYDN